MSFMRRSGISELPGVHGAAVLISAASRADAASSEYDYIL